MIFSIRSENHGSRQYSTISRIARLVATQRQKILYYLLHLDSLALCLVHHLYSHTFLFRHLEPYSLL